MTVNMTVSNQINSKKAGYSGVQKHTEHDPNINHSNKNLDVDRLQFNYYENTLARKTALEDWQEEKFHDFVEDHDKHQRDTGHGERQWGSVKDYIKRKNKPTGVLTLGSVESQGELMKAVCPADVLCKKHSPEGYDYTTFDLEVHKDENGNPMTDAKKYPDEAKRLQKVNAEAKKFYGCINRALLAATENNLGITNKAGKRIPMNDYIYIGRRATNVDEGAGHIHYEIGACGRTRKGRKLTNSFNNALIEFHHAVTGEYASGTESMKWLRSCWDVYALNTLNDELKKSYGIDKAPVAFERKTEKDGSYITGLSMNQFKNKQRLIDKAKKAQNQAKESKKIADDNLNIAQQAQNALRTSYEGATGKKAVHKDKTPMEPQEMLRGLQRHLKKTQDEIKKENDQKADLENQLKNLKDKQAEVEEAIANAQQSLETLRTRLLQRRRQRIEELKKEINDNHLSWNGKQPNITDDNVGKFEKSVTDWHHRNNKALNDKKKDLTEQNESLTKTNHQLAINNQDLKAQNDTLTQQNDDLTNQNTNLTTENNTLQSQNQGLRKEHTTLSKKVAHLKNQVKTLTEEAAKASEAFKYQAGTFVKTHWKELKSVFLWSYDKHKSAEANRQAAMRPGKENLRYTAQAEDSEAKMGIINTFDRIQRQAMKELGKGQQQTKNNDKTWGD